MSYRRFVIASLIIIFILTSIIFTCCGNVKTCGNAKLQNLLESTDPENYTNFTWDMHYELQEKFT